MYDILTPLPLVEAEAWVVQKYYLWIRVQDACNPYSSEFHENIMKTEI